jgi:hypothetical protein
LPSKSENSLTFVGKRDFGDATRWIRRLDSLTGWVWYMFCADETWQMKEQV